MSIKKGIESANSTPLKENVTLNFAIAYSQQLNWHIFPIKYKGKAPITQRGYKDASKDINQIYKWWNENKNRGIAFPTGKINNVVIIDIDPRNGGQVSFDRLVDKYGALPHTVECLTAGGGNHYYLQYDERINKSILKDYPGIDILSDGKYAILPPSFHPNGRQYHFEDASKPVITKLAPIPSWFIELATNRPSNRKHKARPVNDYISILQEVSEGERNNALMTLIGHLIVRLDYREAFEIVHIWNETRVNPPLDKNTVTTAFNNILKREAERR